MPTRYAYLNGHIVPEDRAAISPLDIGLLRGYAVFDLLRTVGGRPFLLAEHLTRLRDSASLLGLSVPVSDDDLTLAITELLALNGHKEATVRLVVTGGVSSDGMSFDASSPTLLILTHDLHEPSEEVYARGARLLTVEHERELPLAKTTDYLTMLVNRPRAAQAGALDLLYHKNGLVSEAATASFYAVQDGTIVAPADGVLHGTIGTFVLGLAAPEYPVVHRNMTIDEVCGADEAFLTSTTRGVVPIVALDERPVGSGTVGPVVTDLMRRFRDAIEAER